MRFDNEGGLGPEYSHLTITDHTLTLVDRPPLTLGAAEHQQLREFLRKSPMVGGEHCRIGTLRVYRYAYAGGATFSGGGGPSIVLGEASTQRLLKYLSGTSDDPEGR